MTEFGDSTVLETREVETPKPKPGEILIRIEAAGLNRLDHYIREGGVNPDISFPFILGSDAVGTVAELGEGVTGFEIGERVIPMPGYPIDPKEDGGQVMSASKSYLIRGIAENGSYAQYMTAPARWTLKDNTGLPATQVATLPMPLVTAVRAVKTVAEIKRGDKVLIHAGASGTGSTMIQVAKALGAEVAVTLRSESKAEFVTSLGADLVVLTSSPNFIEQVIEWSGGGVDAIVDNLGGPSLAQSLEMTKPLGIVVLMGNVLGLESTIPVRSVFFPQRQIRGTLMGDVDDLQWGLEQVRQGNIKPSLDRTFSLDEAKDAHAMLARGDASGNLVFDVQKSHD